MPIGPGPTGQNMNRDPSSTTPEHNCNKDGRLKAVADLYEQNLTPAEIGRRVGLSGRRVKQIARAHGLSRQVPVGEPPLRERQVRMLAFLQAYTAGHPHPPTVREITRACNISSTSVTDYNLRLLEQRQYLSRMPGIARGIALTERGRSPLPEPPDSPVPEAAA